MIESPAKLQKLEGISRIASYADCGNFGGVDQKLVENTENDANNSQISNDVIVIDCTPTPLEHPVGVAVVRSWWSKCAKSPAKNKHGEGEKADYRRCTLSWWPETAVFPARIPHHVEKADLQRPWWRLHCL